MEYADSLWAHLGGDSDTDVTSTSEVDQWMEKVLDEAEDSNLDVDGVEGEPYVETTWNSAARLRTQAILQRTASGEPDWIEAARRIVNSGSYEMIDGMLFDAFSASAVLQVYEAVNDTNKQKMADMGLVKAVDLAFKLANRGNVARRAMVTPMSRKHAVIDDPQHVWTLNPDDPDWIGNFSDAAINANFEYWSSEPGRSSQPYIPGYADEMLRMLTEERTRRSAVRRTAADKYRVTQDVGNPGKWVVQKYYPDNQLYHDVGDAVDSREAAEAKLRQIQSEGTRKRAAATESYPHVILRVKNDDRQLDEIKAYLWSNWQAEQIEDGTIYITGHDVPGYGMDALRDRLLSGLIGTEIVAHTGSDTQPAVNRPGQGVTWARRKRAQDEGEEEGPTRTWPCQQCGETVERWRGEGDVTCPKCGAEYNAFGQRLRDDWRGNPSNYDDDIGDLEGYEMQHAYEGRRRTAVTEGDTSACRICGKAMQYFDHAWYGLKASSPKRDAPKHYCIAASPGRERAGEYNVDGTLTPGEPGGQGGQYDAPAGTIYDNGANPIKVSTRKQAATWHCGGCGATGTSRASGGVPDSCPKCGSHANMKRAALSQDDYDKWFQAGMNGDPKPSDPDQVSAWEDGKDNQAEIKRIYSSRNQATGEDPIQQFTQHRHTDSAGNVTTGDDDEDELYEDWVHGERENYPDLASHEWVDEETGRVRP